MRLSSKFGWACTLMSYSTAFQVAIVFLKSSPKGLCKQSSYDLFWQRIGHLHTHSLLPPLLLLNFGQELQFSAWSLFLLNQLHQLVYSQHWLRLSGHYFWQQE